MNRRRFIANLAATGISASLPTYAQTGPAAILEVSASKKGFTLPPGFTGLSYESAQLANPGYFSPANKQLIALTRELSPNGNLRLGGGSSEFTTYSEEGPAGPPPFEVFGPDTSKTTKRGTVTTELALRNLRGFLDATGWNCLYGLNLGQGTRENAAKEAAAACRILGPRLLAFQIGNEPDSFRNRYRPSTYGPADFMREWNDFHEAIIARTPEAKFAGPDISNKLAFLSAFAEEARKHRDVILLTAHYYAMGPAGSPGATIEQLAEADPKQATMHANGFTEVQEAIDTSGLPFRMSEGNSCWNGGQPGVSNTLASALWCADMMLRFASLGWSGVNLHGGGNGLYAPIVGAPSTGFTRRPEYFGIQFAQSLVGSTILNSTLIGAGPHVAAYAFERHGMQQIAIINKDNAPVGIALPSPVKGRAMRLAGPGLEKQEGTVFEKTHVTPTRQVTVPAHTGMIYEL